MRPKPLHEKHPQMFTFIGYFTVRKTFLFPGKFQTHRFSWFRCTVVSSEKIIRFQSISSTEWAQSSRFCRCFSVESGFDIGRLNLAPYSFNRRRIVS